MSSASLRLAATLVGWVACAVTALGQCSSGSDGSDGPFTFVLDAGSTTTMTIDLRLAADGPWNMPSPVEGQGVYDAANWAVVFKYTTITIPASRTVRFINHRSGAPVVWLATGDVLIQGTVNLDGAPGASGTLGPRFAEAGPGGFDGGARGADALADPASGGFGPGGAFAGLSTLCGAGSGFGASGSNSVCTPPTVGGPAYGDPTLVPLIGGSGGSAGIGISSGNAPSGNAGAGGGAITIAATFPSTINVQFSASVRASGGSGGFTSAGAGSGGAIRLIANTVTVNGSVTASGGVGGSGGGGSGAPGRIRIDSPTVTGSGSISPTHTSAFTCRPVFQNVPTIRVVEVGGQAVPADPSARITTIDTQINAAGPVDIEIAGAGIPSAAQVTVQLIIVPARGQRTVTAYGPFVPNPDGTLSEILPDVTLPPELSEIQVRATWTP